MAKEDSEKQEKLLAEWQAKQPPKGDDTESEDESDKEAAKSKKKKKAQKDPNKPKGAKTAYIFYSVENRPRLLESNPGATFAESVRVVFVNVLDAYALISLFISMHCRAH